MKLTDGAITAEVNTINWPLVLDILIKMGEDSEEILSIRERGDTDVTIRVRNVDSIVAELSAWGIPWKKI